MKGLLKEEGTLHVYQDPRQRLQNFSQELPSSIVEGAERFELEENVRNTQRIHETAMMFHPEGDRFQSKCKIGPKVTFRFEDYQTEDEIVGRVIERLIETEGVPSSDIAVLTPLSLRRGVSSWVPDGSRVGGKLLVHHLNGDPNEIFCSSIRSAKGLEFPVVIMTELFSEQLALSPEEIATHLYVGCARARSLLFIVGKKTQFEKLAKESMREFEKNPVV